MAEKQIAVVVRQYNKEEPTKAIDVVEKAIREPGQGIVALSSMSAYSPSETSLYVHACRFMYESYEDTLSILKPHNAVIDDCSPSAGQAQVRMIYRPINPSDIFCCQGIYGGFRPKLPAAPGLEGENATVLLAELVAGHV